jgi:hypothetical protein
MGSFYTSFVLKGATAAAAQKALIGRNAVVASEGAIVVVFDEEAEDQNEDLFNDLAAFLSHELRATVLAVLNHDDSVLIYALYDAGVRKDSYNSNPGYFDDGPMQASGGNAAAICEMFNCGGKSALQKILRAPAENYVFESERHADIVRCLGLPEWVVGLGFTQIANSEMPDDADEIELLWAKDLPPSPEASPGYYRVVIPNPAAGHDPISLPIGWLPATWQKLRADECDLSDRCRRAVEPIRKSIEALGFELIAFQKFVDILNPKFVDGAGVFYLNKSREILGHVVYLIYAGASGEIESKVCTFRGTFGNEALVCTNQPPSPLANPPNFTIVFEKAPDPLAVFNRFQEELRKRPGPPQKFEDTESIATQFDADAIANLHERVRKGQYFLMNPFEVWRAQKIRSTAR